MDVARTLRDARGRAGLSQAELARRAATSQAAISAYESSAKEPSVATLSRLLTATGSRLTVDPAPPRVLVPSPAQQSRAGRIFADVLALADALPTHHELELRFPRLDPPASGLR
jgi:transcriptional regulator with XRE-family HTH domain